MEAATEISDFEMQAREKTSVSAEEYEAAIRALALKRGRMAPQMTATDAHVLADEAYRLLLVGE